MSCPLGLEFCDQRRFPPDAKFFDVTCDNYYYCRSWVKPWNLPLQRITQRNFLWNAFGHDYYLVEFSYPRLGMQGIHDIDWAAYFAEYGYAEAVPLPSLNRLSPLLDSETVVHYIPRRVPVKLPNGMTIVMTMFDSIITLSRSQD